MAIPFVVIKLGKCALEVHWRSVGAPDTHERVADFLVDLLGPVTVIADKEVERPITIEINPCRTGAPAIRRSADSGYFGHIAKLAAAFVVKQVISPDACDVYIAETVIVVIANRDTHSVDWNIQARA